MTERNPLLVILWMLISCGFYGFYYEYATTQEVTAATGRTDVNATTELLLNLITCGLFGMYAQYRNQQLVDQWFTSRGIQHDTKAQTVGLLNLLTLVAGVTWLVATYIHQDDLNRMIAASRM
jgi:hypothetical protein